ncbi:1,3-beta-glucanosyltransferase SCDLUD_002497 [Saccharomycodes ludwigii]|uniref:1,3-beta-glucanosyltransferase n=1 Tax=Saccharomycodes ludwigii TaxID=36035 RepID=UPI001E8927C0|nr:hypothetical protein SCDLUD_002497 [Saccharomycodes ludwigii]KAH3901027.1 hypothetical protein SCDLUD_002497 [Saccharomycodes ludwigii]
MLPKLLTTSLFLFLVLFSSNLKFKLFADAATEDSTDSKTPPVTVKGNAFWITNTSSSTNTTRFYIRGVDYQPGGSSNLTDPLADEDACARDVKYFEELGINTVRVYTIDNSESHDSCMKILQEHGIYLILDVNTPTSAIDRDNPKCSYNADYLQNVFATIDEFAKFDNVLGFFAGNEVINNSTNTYTAPYVKAVVRDMKKYLKARNYRQIPVGYSAADVSSNRLLTAEYFNCGNDSDARIDMFGVNDYSWCGDSSFTLSGYSQKVELYKGYSVPIFLSEFGCNEVVSSRPFTEVQAIYSDKMSGVFSGGLVYEYTNETNNYGLVQIDPDNSTNVTILQDFTNLQKQYASVENPSGDGGYSDSYNYSTCPSYEEGTWEVNITIPEMPTAASIYFKSGAGQAYGTGLSTESDCVDDDDYDDSSSSSMISASSSTVHTNTSSIISASSSSIINKSNSTSKSNSTITTHASITSNSTIITRNSSTSNTTITKHGSSTIVNTKSITDSIISSNSADKDASATASSSILSSNSDSSGSSTGTAKSKALASHNIELPMIIQAICSLLNIFII